MNQKLSSQRDTSCRRKSLLDVTCVCYRKVLVKTIARDYSEYLKRQLPQSCFCFKPKRNGNNKQSERKIRTKAMWTETFRNSSFNRKNCLLLS